MPQWFLNCEVTRTGPTSDKDKTLVQLSNRSGAFRDRWFTAAPSVRRELLATALTAISLGSRVEALVDDGAPEFGTLYTMYVAIRPLDRPLPAPPAVGDPRGYLAQVPRVVYRADDDHIHEFAIYPDSGRWGHFDMTAATGAPPAAGNPFGYFHDVPRVVYRANDGRIYELAIDPASGSWGQFDMTTATGAPPAVSDPSGYSAGVPRVIYRARDGHIHELAIDPPSGAWGRFDMTAATGAPPAAALDVAPFGYFHDVPRVVYWASDAHIHEFAIDPANGSWGVFDMTAATGAPPAVSAPSGYSAGVPRVIYRADDGHIHEFAIDPASGSWGQFDMTTATGAPVPAARDVAPSGYFHDVPRVVYWASDAHVHEFAIDPASGGWGDFDMTAATGGPPTVGGPSGYSAGVPRVVYRANDGHIHEFSIDPASGTWQQFDLHDAVSEMPP